MSENNQTSVYLGKKTRIILDKYAEENDISRSAVIKLAVHKFLREVH